MSRKRRIDYPGAVHFLTNRGTAQTMIFRSDRDRRAFLALLGEIAERFDVWMFAHVLMGNHYHLIAESRAGRLAEALHHLNGNHARRFNSVHERTGTLFQGRYDQRLITDEAHLERAGIYLHLNPVKAGLVADPADYPWSSFGAYRSGRSPAAWLRLDLLRGRSGAEFVSNTKDTMDAMATIDDADDDSIHAWCSDRDGATEAAFRESDRAVADAFGASIDELYIPSVGKQNLVRTVAIVHAARVVDQPLAYIARHYGLQNVNAVRSARRRLRQAASKDRHLAEKLRSLDAMHDERLAG